MTTARKAVDGLMGDFGEFGARVESSCKMFAVDRGAQKNSLEGEVLPDRAEAREECLRAFVIANPSAPPVCTGVRLALLSLPR